jgi:hypothetical protein
MPAPELRLLVLTDLYGYLEPCGCTSRPLGGIDRLAAQLRDLRDDGPPTLFVAAGDLFFDGTSHGAELPEAATQEIWKAETVADVLSGLELAAAAPGALDLRFGADRFRALRERARFPLLASGASIPAAAPDAAPLALDGHVVREVGGIRVGIVGVSDLEGAPDPIEAARREARAARAEGAQLVVALVRAPRRTVRRLAGEDAGIDFLVQGGANDAEAHVPTSEGTPVLHAAHHGAGVLVVDLWRGPADGGGSPAAAWHDVSAWTRTAERDHARRDADELRARIAEWERDTSVAPADLEDQRARLRSIEQRMEDVARAPEPRLPAFSARFVELPQTAPRDPAVESVLDAYFRRVNEHNREAFASLLPAPAPEGRPRFVGTIVCGSCHREELAWWRTTLHGRAYRTLQDLHKEYNLSCVGCHVTGYNQPGGSTVSHVGDLQDVGCETCHGAGSMHVADPEEAAVPVRRDAPEEVCAGCHNPEHSDRFHYPTYRRMMIAPGHGMPAEGPTGAGR